MTIIIDGKQQILGRIAAYAAKKVLNGEEVAIFNAEGVVMTGDMAYLVEKYLQRRSMQDKSTPEHSPHWPRRPDLFVRRIARGMMPFKHPRGRAAFKRLHVFLGKPEGLEGEKITVPGADAEKLNTKYHTVAELCRRLGYA